jgi:hypothetical protein
MEPSSEDFEDIRVKLDKHILAFAAFAAIHSRLTSLAQARVMPHSAAARADPAAIEDCPDLQSTY